MRTHILLCCFAVFLQDVIAQNTCFLRQEDAGNIARLSLLSTQDELADFDNDGDLDYIVVYGANDFFMDVYTSKDNGSSFSLTSSFDFSGFATAAAFVLGDVNNDGFVDIIDADLNTDESPEIRLRSNQLGDGFSTQTIYTNFNTNQRISCAPRLVDYDNDGDLDVSFGVSPEDPNDASLMQVILLENQGNGQFAERVLLERTDSFIQTVIQIEWADMNNDGSSDLFINYDAPDNLRFLDLHTNDGEGNLTFQSSPIGQSTALVIHTGDMDNDGDLDLVTIDTSNGPAVYFNDNLRFTPQILFTDNQLAPFRLTLGDLNHDGFLDMLIGRLGFNDGIVIQTDFVMNNGGTSYFRMDTREDVYNFSIGDINRDNKLDIVYNFFRDQANIIQYFFADAGNNFCTNEMPEPPTDLISSPDNRDVILTWDMAQDAQQASSSLTYNIYMYRVEDGEIIISPDSDLDSGLRQVVEAGRQGHHPKWLYRNLPSGTYRWRVQTVDHHYQGSKWSEEDEFTISVCPDFVAGRIIDGGYSSDTKFGDYNNDGALDAFIVHTTGGEFGTFSQLHVLQNKQGTFPLADPWEEEVINAEFIDLGDPDNDGDLDVLVINGFSLSILENQDGNYTQKELANSIEGWTNSNAQFIDFDNDGDLDIAYYSRVFFFQFSGVTLLENTGDLNFESHSAFQMNETITSLRAADFDNDGDTDLLASKSDPAIADLPLQLDIHINNGGDFSEIATVGSYAQAGGDYDIGDFDNDGDLDVVASGFFQFGAGTFLFLNSNLNFGNGDPITLTNTGYNHIRLADYNNDGLLDIAASTYLYGFDPASPSLTDLTTLYRNIDGTSVAEESLEFTADLGDNFGTLPVGVDPEWVDINNDGYLDIFQNLYGELGERGVFNDANISFLHTGECDENTPPEAPQNPFAQVDGDNVVFVWDEATDAQQRGRSLSYNLLITSEDGTVLFPPSDSTSGFNKVVEIGLQSQHTKTFISNLPIGNYCFKVQAIDHSFIGGAWSEPFCLNTSPCTDLDFVSVTTPASCGAANGSISIDPRGGTPPYVYSWSNGESTSTITGLAAGNYVLTVFDANGCATGGSITLEGTPSPNAPVSLGDISVCSLEEAPPLQVQVPTGIQVNWYDSPTATAPIRENTNLFFTSTSRTVYAEAFDPQTGCVSDTRTALTFTLNPRPSLMITTECDPSLQTYTIFFETNDFVGIEASREVINTVDFSYVIENVPIEESVDIVLRAFETGCTAGQTVTPPDCTCPTIAPPQGSDVFICENEDNIPLSVMVETGQTATWFDAAGNVIAENTTSITPQQAGVYSVLAIDIENGCTSQLVELRYEILPLPNITISGNLQVCEGETTALTANGGLEYTWNTNANSATIVVGAGTYTVTGIDANGCINSATVTVNTLFFTDAFISGNTVICESESTTLTAEGGESFLWSTQETTQSVNINAPGIYEVEITNADGCTAIAEVEVIQNPLPIIDEITSECAPDLSSYSINIFAGFNDEVTASAGEVNFLDESTYRIENIMLGQNVFVTIRDQQTGCSITREVESPECACPTIPSPQGSDVFVCDNGDSNPISVRVTDGLSANWIDASGNVVARNTTTIFAEETQTYFVEAIDPSNGCVSERIQIRYEVLPLPNIQITGNLEICAGETTTLTASGGLEYVWSTQATSVSITVSTGTYTLTGTDENGCLNSATVTVTELPPTQASITGNTQICEGESTILIASGGGNYQWSNFAQSDRIEVREAGIYEVTVTDENGCEGTAEVEVVINPLPRIDNLSSTCAPSLTTYTVSFFTAISNNVDTNAGELVALDDFGNYEVSGIPIGTTLTISVVDNETGCFTNREVPSPDCTCPEIAAPEGSDVSVCANAESLPLSVTVSDGLSVNWTDAGGNVIAENTTSITPTQTGSYFAQAINPENGCTSDAIELRYEILPLPNIQITGNLEVCAGETTTLTASGGLEYVWSTQATSVSITVGAGTYTLTGTDENGCLNSATITVTEFPITEVSITGNTQICEGESMILIASGGVNYQWSNFAQSDRIEVREAGIYEVTVTDENGCEGMEEVEVIVNPLPRIDNLSSTCAPNLTTYTVSFFTAIRNNVDINAGELVALDDFGNYEVRGIPIGTTLTISVVDNETGCFTSREVPSPDCTCPEIAAPEGSDVSVCVNAESLPLSVSVADGLSVNWTDADGNVIAENTTSITPTQTGSYFAQAINPENDCTSDAIELRYEILPLSNIQITGNLEVCAGETTTLTASGGLEYVWSNQATSVSITVGAGTYTLTGTDENGCLNSATVTVTELPPTQASITGNTQICEGESTILTASGGTSYQWSNFAQSDRIEVREAGIYEVTVTDENGCEGVAEVEVVINPLPRIDNLSSTCAPSLTTYTVSFFTVVTNNVDINEGELVALDDFGNYEVRGISIGTALTISVADNETGCFTSREVPSPDCSCPDIAAPEGSDISVCANAESLPLVVSVADGLSVNWTDADGNVIAENTTSITPTQTGSYFAQAINPENGCTSDAIELRYEILPLPNIQITGNLEICAGETTTLTASGGLEYVWSTQATSVSITVGAGTYTLTGTDENGCLNSATVRVTEFPLTEVSITGNTQICQGESTILAASGGINYQWSNFAQSDRVEVREAGIYEVTVTDTNGCESVAEVEVIVNELPDISEPVIECASNLSTYIVSFTTETTYLVSASVGEVIQEDAGVYRIVDIPIEDNITITIEDEATTCRNQREFTPPNCDCPFIAAPQGEDVIVCANAEILPLSVTVEEGLQVNWLDADNNLLVANSTTLIPDFEGTYFAQAIDPTTNCVSQLTELRFETLPVPQITIDGQLEICEGETTTLTASGGAEYIWNTQSTEESIEVNEAGIYSVQAIDGNGCEGSVEAQVVVQELPFISEVMTNCSEDRQSYEARFSTDLFALVQASAGEVIMETESSFLITDIPISETLSIRVEQEEIPCFSTHEVSPPDCDCPFVAAPQGESVSFCENEEPSGLNVVRNDAVIVNWYDAAGNLLAEGTVFFQAEISGSYFAEAVDLATGCTSELLELEYTIFLLPEITIDGQLEICTGETTTLTASGGLEYFWNTEETSESINVGAGTYTITGIDANGCQNSATVTVTESIIGEIAITGNTVICEGESTILAAIGGTNYLWNTGQTSDTIAVNEAGIYEVTATDEAGCSTSAEVQLIVNAAPSISEFSVDCSEDRQTYQVSFSTNLFAIVEASVGEVISQTESSYLITNIPISESISISIQDADTDCITTRDVSPPDCDCPFVDAPDGQNVSICEGDESIGLSVAVDASSTVNWYDAAGNLLVESTLSFLPEISGSYFAQAVDLATGCTSELLELAYTIFPTPEIRITGETQICEGESTVLTASGGAEYIWNNQSNEESIEVSEAGIYSVQAIDGNGCEGSVEVQVVVQELPFISEIVTNCSEDRQSYEARFSTDLFALVQASAGEVIMETESSFLITGIPISETLSIRVEQEEIPCFSTREVAPPDCDCPFVAAPQGESVSLCANEEPSGLNVVTNDAVIVNWYDAAGNLLAEETVFFQPEISGSYFAQAVDLATGCTSELLDLEYTIFQSPEIRITGETQICEGESTTLTASGGAEYIWSNQSNEESIEASEADIYSVQAIDGNGCEGSTEIEVIENPSPTIEILSVECSEDLGTYTVIFSTETFNTVLPSIGEVTFLDEGLQSVPNIPIAATLVLTIQNEAGCELVQEISPPDCNCPFVEPPTNFGDVLVCEGEFLGDLLIDVLDSQTAEWYDAPTGGEFLVRGTSFTPPQAGTYFAQAVDVGTGCASERIALTAGFAPSLQVEIEVLHTTCGEANGSIALDISGGTAPYSIEWGSGQETPTISELEAGGYAARITDALDCLFVTEGIELLPSTAPSIELLESIAPECDAENGSISISVVGGREPYTFTWSNGATTQNLFNISEGEYQVLVSDADGCEASLLVELDCVNTCISDVGTLAEQALNVCETEPVSATYDSTNEILDENDLLQFILHNGSADELGNRIIARSSEPTFSFDAALMQTEKTYYIAAIVGDNDGTGNVDLESACLAISEGVPVRFGVAPPAIIEVQATNTIICLGDSLSLMAAIEGVADGFIWETPQGVFETSNANFSLPFFGRENEGDYFVSYLRGGCESPQFGPLSVVLDESTQEVTAGDNQILCGDKETTLEGVLPAGATGRWVTTSPAVIENPSSPNTRVRNLQPGAYNTFFWTVFTAGCTAIDTMTIYYAPQPELEDKEYEMNANNSAILLNKDFLLDGDARLLPADAVNYEILTLPEWGVVFDTTGGILYERDIDQVDDLTIEFTYEACVTDSLCGELCDGARVRIEVRYEDSEVIAWRQALRPNGNNPLWAIQILKNLSEASLKIVDRWGQIVHVQEFPDGIDLRRGSTIAEAWDGRNPNGELLPQGAYYFLFTGTTDANEEIEPVSGVIYLMD